MTKFLKNKLFAGAAKNSSAPYVFIVLCVYTVINSTYTGLFFDIRSMIIRYGLSFIILIGYVIIERSPLSEAATAFISPLLITAVLISGAIYFGGDFLLFTYNSGIAIISLTYLKPKSLAAYIAVSSAAFAAVMFGFGINLLGPAFNTVYNILYFVASCTMNILFYVFAKSYVQNLADLIEAKNEASLASQAKSAFLANMSHEIRTPLNAVIGLTEAELRRDLPQADIENIRKINTSGNLLKGIINDILDMSKIESGKFDLVPVTYNFADMIYDAVNLNIVHIGAKPIDFIVTAEDSVPCTLKGDELRVKQLLNNVLSNAFKYTREGKVELRASWRRAPNGAKLVFEIADTGIGIRPGDLKKLFSEYAQVNQKSTRGIEGTGLGLAICKGLAELMGGSITVQSEYGAGSVFTIEVVQEIIDSTPIGAKVAAALRESTYTPEFTEAGVEFVAMPYAKVLVVDDVDLNLEVAVACLEPYGINVDCTDNGAEALRLIKESDTKYDLVFMDHMMPIMDGIATTSAIRELGTEYAAALPIVALTANAIAGNEQMFADKGFQGFLSKPIEPKKLDELLRKWVYRAVDN